MLSLLCASSSEAGGDVRLLAQVTVVVWNTGGDAYRPAVYGDFITVVKRIHQTSASWGIYGARGNLVRCDSPL